MGRGRGWGGAAGVRFGVDLDEALLDSGSGDPQRQQQQHQSRPDLEDAAILSFGESAPQQQQQQQFQQQQPRQQPGANELHPVGDVLPPPPQQQQQQQRQQQEQVAPAPSPAVTAAEPPSSAAAPVYDASFLQIVCYVA